MKYLINSLLVSLSLSGMAATTYVESVDGELGFAGSPTVLDTTGATIFTLSGTVGSTEQDYFLLTLAPTQTLNSMTLTSASGSSATFGIYDGSTNADTVLTTPSAFESWSTANTGDDFLVEFGSGPLTDGTYLIGFWHDNSPFIDYTFELDIATVPEPSTSLFGVLACTGFLLRRRR